MSVDTFSEGDFRAKTSATEGQLTLLRRYYELLLHWNDRMNLVGPSAAVAFWGRHVWDSAQLLHVEQSSTTWADIGAGAGFPGVVLAILLKEREGALVHLVESMAKRVSFLNAVVDELQLPVIVHHARAEALQPAPAVEVVTARACAPLPRLLDYTAGFFRAGARGLFLKGRDVEAELTQARRSWTFRSELIPSRSDPSGRLLRIERPVPRARRT